MNQILLTENVNNRKKNSKKYDSNNSLDMKKIMLFFGIAILVFAVLMIGIYAYKMINKNKKETREIGKPELQIEQMENQVKIVVNAEAGIDRIIYMWNNNNPEEYKKEGITSFEESLEIPNGENTLKVKVIDLNGEEIESNNELVGTVSTENTIKIELDSSIGNGKLKITATDEINGLKYIKYKWNNEKETKVKATEQDQKIIETTIEVKRDTNTITITAVNNNDEEEILEQDFQRCKQTCNRSND